MYRFDFRSLDADTSIAAAFLRVARLYPERVIWEQLSSDNNTPRRTSTASEDVSIIARITKKLSELGVKAGDKVAIISNSRPEWMQADLAILSLGAVTVSVYQSLPAHDVGYILFDAECRFVIAENQEQVDKLQTLAAQALCYPAHEDREAGSTQLSFASILCIEECVQTEALPKLNFWQEVLRTTEANEEFLEQCIAGSKRDLLATLVYTSGTTGPPKGVSQTHGNHLSNVRQAYQSTLVSPGDSLLIVLPLAHSFARLMGYLAYLAPAKLIFPSVTDTKSSKPNPELMLRDIGRAGATIVPVVPRLLEKIKSGLEAAAHKPAIASFLLLLFLRVQRRCAEYRRQGRAPLLHLQILSKLLAGIGSKVKRKLFGENLHYLISGGAKLNPLVNSFFDNLGIEVLEGYGLTETCVATNVNISGKKKIGTVGPVLSQDIEIRIAEDGEICFRGPNVTSGYFARPTATKASWDEQGFFHTGDLGSLDGDGYLSIIGRKKELLVTSYGKKIAPEAVETRLKSISLVSQAVLVGDGRAYCVALLTLDTARLQSLYTEWGLAESERVPEHAKVREYLHSHIAQVNKELASHESVKNFAIIDEEFTIDNGLLTPTFKIKRKPVLEKYAACIEALYHEP